MARTPTPSIDLFEAIGGTAKCRELSSALYARVATDPILRPLFPGRSFRCAIEELTAFLVQFLGGPSEDARYRWWLSLRESHLRFKIGQAERDAWIGHMTKALDDVEMNEFMRSSLRELFGEASTYVVNTGPVAAATKCPALLSGVHSQIGRRWEQQRALDEAVAAIRVGELNRLAAVATSPLLRSLFELDRSIFANFVGVLIGCRNDAMAEYAHDILAENSDLAHERYSGRSLLHSASAAGSLPIVAALLRLGVDANIQDASGHTPVYSVGNECTGGGVVVKALVKAGAKVDACDGVKRCTALHMAARRDNVEAAEALLECGADIEARDALRETPLRRAVNCGQTRVAALLLEKGADPHSVGSKGLTPLSAARVGSMRELLQARARR